MVAGVAAVEMSNTTATVTAASGAARFNFVLRSGGRSRHLRLAVAAASLTRGVVGCGYCTATPGVSAVVDILLLLLLSTKNGKDTMEVISCVTSWSRCYIITVLLCTVSLVRSSGSLQYRFGWGDF